MKMLVRAIPLLFASAAVLSFASPAIAADADDQPRSANAQNSDKICRREKQIGSNIPVTVCRTRAQMDAEEAAARSEVDGVSTRPSDF